MKEEPEKVKKMLESLKVDLPVLMDKYGKAAEKYKALTLPRIVIINSRGMIVYEHTGYDKGMKDMIEQTLKEITNQSD